MTEGLSDERIEHITGCLNAPDVAGLSEGFARELLAEVKRVRVLLAVETATCKRWLQRTVELGTRTANAEARCDDLRDERDELARVAMQRGEQATKWSTQLAEIGETCQEWAADGPAGWMQWPVPEESEAYARRIVEDAIRVGLPATLMRRLAGEWREVPHA